ncbi:MAG TPA: VCBS repeat-containing protein [Opitutaceae bacterium]|nr:VCBS repeat-containing protein [Opitutaceae bacterium]
MKGRPVITHVAMCDLDGDGLLDILVCDALANTVSCIRQSPRGVFTEVTLAEVPGPAHVSTCDLNQDGKLDMLVACMSVILPNNDRIGSVVVLENLGSHHFKKHVLADRIARVTDVRGADLNADGKIDLVVGQFGYTEGEVRWMENKGSWNFESHIVLSKPGTIHTPVADFNGDGRPDFAALVSQDDEEVHVFTNLGDGHFQDEIVWKAADPSWNSSGLEVCDLNGDGHPDLLCTNGDGFNEAFMCAAPWHGLQWFENDGHGRFLYRRIGDMTGCYSPCPVDLNGDGHLDVVTVSGFNDANNANAVWLQAWINDGHEHFRTVPLAHDPTHLITVAAGDLDGNGVPVLVTGGFHLFPPFQSMSRVTLWRRRSAP